MENNFYALYKTYYLKRRMCPNLFLFVKKYKTLTIFNMIYLILKIYLNSFWEHFI